MADLTRDDLNVLSSFLYALDARHAKGTTIGGGADVYLNERYVGTLQRAYPEGEGDAVEDVWTYCIRTDSI